MVTGTCGTTPLPLRGQVRLGESGSGRGSGIVAAIAVVVVAVVVVVGAFFIPLRTLVLKSHLSLFFLSLFFRLYSSPDAPFFLPYCL